MSTSWHAATPRAATAAAGAVPRPGRLVAQPLRAGLRRLARRAQGWPSRCRTFAAASASSTWRRAPTTRATSRRSAGSCSACAQRTPAAAAAGGGRLAGRQRAAALGRGGGRQRRAAWPARWPPSRRRVDLAAGGHAIGRGFNRLVYTRMFLQHHEAQGAGQAGPAPGPVRPRRAAGRARPVRVRQRLHRAAARLSRTPTTTGRAPRPSRTCARIRIPALVVNARNDPFVPASQPAAARRGRAATSRCGSRAHGGHVGFPQGALPGHVHAMPEAVGGWLLQHAGPAREHRRMDDIVRQAHGQVAQRARTATAGWGWTRAATGTCATTASQAAGPFASGQPVPRAAAQARQADRLHRPQLRGRRAGALVLPERPAARLRGTGSHALGLAPAGAMAGTVRGDSAHRPAGASARAACSTSTAGCTSTPTSASAWCTRRTCTCGRCGRAGLGRPRTCRQTNCPPAWIWCRSPQAARATGLRMAEKWIAHYRHLSTGKALKRSFFSRRKLL